MEVSGQLLDPVAFRAHWISGWVGPRDCVYGLGSLRHPC